MGRQVNFYQLPEDLRVFEEALRSRNDLIILQHAWKGPVPEENPDLIASLPTSEHPRDPRMVLIVRMEDIDRLNVVHREGLGYWTADIRSSPVIEFTRSFYNGDILAPGRLYLVPDGKEEDFLSFGASLFRWIRSRYTRPKDRGFQLYRAPEAQRWVKAASGALAPL